MADLNDMAYVAQSFMRTKIYMVGIDADLAFSASGNLPASWLKQNRSVHGCLVMAF